MIRPLLFSVVLISALFIGCGSSESSNDDSQSSNAGSGGDVEYEKTPPSVEKLLVEIDKQTEELSKMSSKPSPLELVLTMGASGVPSAIDAVKAAGKEEAAVTILAGVIRDKRDSQAKEDVWHCFGAINAIADLGLANEEAMSVLQETSDHPSEAIRNSAKDALDELSKQ